MSENGTLISVFKQRLQTNPPRLVVLFRYDEQGVEQFQWGMVGSIQLMTLIGSIAPVCRMMYDEEKSNPIFCECEESAFVIIFDGGEPTYWINRDIPRLPLLGMLETIKMALIGSKIGQQAAAQKTQILGPDGSPLTNRIKGL